MQKWFVWRKFVQVEELFDVNVAEVNNIIPSSEITNATKAAADDGV